MNAMENMKLGSCEPVVYIKEENYNISPLNPIDLNIQDEEDEIGDKSEHKVYCSLTVVNPEEITYDSLGSDDYNSDWVFGLQTSEGSHHNQQLAIKNNESSQQSVIECDLSNDSTYSRLNDNSSSDNSSMYTYYSLPNDSSLVSFSHQDSYFKRIDSNDWNQKKQVPEQKKVVSKVVSKVEKTPPVKKTFACPICNKIFASKSNLERHGVVHSDVKPFQCVECKRMFSRRVHLERHKFLHMDQKPFNCEICKKGFTQKTHLVKHQYVHTGVKPFPCTICEKSFARKESLNRHKGLHPPNETKDTIDNKNNIAVKKINNPVSIEKKKELNKCSDTFPNKVNSNNLINVKRMKTEIKNDKNIISNSEKMKSEFPKLFENPVVILKEQINIKGETNDYQININMLKQVDSGKGYETNQCEQKKSVESDKKPE